MTDDELAEEYIDEYSPCFKEYPKAPRGALKQAYLAGLKAGRPEWHDLRKDPDDLPPVGIGVIISGYLGDMKGLLGLDDWDGVEWTNTDIPGLVREAWCEIPEFKEE